MTEDKFVTFRKFSTIGDARELISALKDSEIEVQVEDNSPPVDITFSGSTLQHEIRVKIRPDDFEAANGILETLAGRFVDTISDDHYLYDFTDEELIDVIEKYDEWSKEDYLLSLKILKERGLEMSEEKIEALRQKRLDDLRKPEKGHSGWLVFGFICALLGGLFGIFIGWFYATSRKTDPAGQRVYAYDEHTRKMGQRIFWTGVICIILWASIFLLRN